MTEVEAERVDASVASLSAAGRWLVAGVLDADEPASISGARLSRLVWLSPSKGKKPEPEAGLVGSVFTVSATCGRGADDGAGEGAGAGAGERGGKPARDVSILPISRSRSRSRSRGGGGGEIGGDGAILADGSLRMLLIDDRRDSLPVTVNSALPSLALVLLLLPLLPLLLLLLREESTAAVVADRGDEAWLLPTRRSNEPLPVAEEGPAAG